MKRSLPIPFIAKLDLMLSSPEYDRINKVRKRYICISIVSTLITGLIILAGFLIAGRAYKTLISYMVVLLAGIAVIQLAMICIRKGVRYWSLFTNIWIIVISFIFMLKLGGITHSAGIAVAGFGAVISSLACQSVRCTMITMMIYLLTIVAAGIMHPKLTIPAEMTPELNNTMFVVMIIIVTISGLSWVVAYLKQHIVAEQSENMKVVELADDVAPVGICVTEIKDARLHDPFMQKLHNLLDRNIDDHQFGIPQLCNAMGISRAQMYRKFKALTGRTLHDYLRSYRLKRAKELLLTTDLNVSETAYSTGFTNVSHFSRIFTEEFGKHPRDLRKSLILSP